MIYELFHPHGRYASFTCNIHFAIDKVNNCLHVRSNVLKMFVAKRCISLQWINALQDNAIRYYVVLLPYRLLELVRFGGSNTRHPFPTSVRCTQSQHKSDQYSHNISKVLPHRLYDNSGRHDDTVVVRNDVTETTTIAPLVIPSIAKSKTDNHHIFSDPFDYNNPTELFDTRGIGPIYASVVVVSVARRRRRSCSS